MSRKVIFGFVGEMGSGKGAAAEYLKEKYGASTFQFSGMLRDILTRLYLPFVRSNLQKTAEMLIGTFGEDTLARVMAEDVAKDQNLLVAIEGIRRVADCTCLFKLPEFVLVEISADIEKRLERINRRGENPDDTTLSMEQFKLNHERSTEKSIAEIAAQASERIDNNGSVDAFHEQLDQLVKKYQ